jgi:uncharacterized protein
MRISGSADLHASAEAVYAALADPSVLLRTLPGCQQVEAIGPDHNRMTITAGVGSIKGTYLGSVHIVDEDPPHGYTLKASGSSVAGTIDATARITLTPSGDVTHLDYHADAVVGGPIGGVGQRMLAGVAKKLAAQFFSAVDDELTMGPQVHEAFEVPATASASAANHVNAADAPRIFRRPQPVPRSVDLGDPALLLGAAVLGAAVALAGVAVGARLRRSSATGEHA